MVINKFLETINLNENKYIINSREMLTNALKTLVKNLVKEHFYKKKIIIMF